MPYFREFFSPPTLYPLMKLLYVCANNLFIRVITPTLTQKKTILHFLRDGAHILEQHALHSFDAILIDNSDEVHAESIVIMLRAAFPKLPLVVCDHARNEITRAVMVNAGATGYIWKNMNHRVFGTELRKIITPIMEAPPAQAIAA